MSSTEYTFKLAENNSLVVVVHTGLQLEAVYDHLVRTGLYNSIKTADLTTTVNKDVRDEFIKDLR
jgi:hypothetical protein